MGIIIIIIIIIVLIIELTHSQTMMENSLKINCLSIAPKEPTTNGIIFTFTFQIFGNFTDLDTFLSSLSPSPTISRNCKINDLTSSPLLINYNKIWSPSFHNMISLNTEIPQDFIIFIL